MAARNVVRFLKSAKISFSSADRSATGAWYVHALAAAAW
jgi:hypothetical protein